MESKTKDHSNKRRRLSPEQEDSVIEVLSSQQEVPADNVIIQIPAPRQAQDDGDSESDDDDAPEVVDNSAQLMALKVQAQKQKEAKRRLVLLSISKVPGCS